MAFTAILKDLTTVLLYGKLSLNTKLEYQTTKNDYALNKFSEGIIYQFSNGIQVNTVAMKVHISFVVEQPKEKGTAELSRGTLTVYWSKDRPIFSPYLTIVSILPLEFFKISSSIRAVLAFRSSTTVDPPNWK